jgi:hypothetical protein
MQQDARHNAAHAVAPAAMDEVESMGKGAIEMAHALDLDERGGGRWRRIRGRKWG